jgi:hypothetical protein
MARTAGTHIREAHLTNERFVQTIHQLATRADTSLVIVSAAILESLLEEALLSKMRDDLPNDIRNDLFKGYGPLASFSAKIQIGDAFEIIDGDLAKDFHAIRHIRNAFAHADQVVSFDSPRMANKFSKLRGYTRGCSARRLFEQRIDACTRALSRHVNMEHFAAALRQRANETNP